MRDFADASEHCEKLDCQAGILAALQRILDSAEFAGAERKRDFLRYVVQEAVSGRASRLKGYSIAIEVFGRDTSFDPQTDTLVRVEAGRLRQSLERYYLTSGASDPIRISIPKGGYVPKFKYVDDPPSPAKGITEVQPAEVGQRERQTPRGWTRWAVPASFALVVIAATADLVTNHIGRESIIPDPPAQEVVTAPSLVIQPLSPVDGSVAENTFALGLTQELTAALARFKNIQVISPSIPQIALSGAASAPLDRGRPVNHYVLTGSVRKISEVVRTVIQLEEPSTGALLWTRIFDSKADGPDILDAQSDIAGKVASTLGDPYEVLFANEAKRAATARSDSVDAYVCTLRFYAYRDHPRPAEHRRLRACHEASVAAAPHFAEAWSNLAWLYLDEYRFDYNPVDTPKAALDRAADAAQRAVSLQPDNARAHLAMAIVDWFRHERRGFDQHAATALALNANDPVVAAELGLRFALSGEWEWGQSLIKRVVSRDPLRWQMYRVVFALHAIEVKDYALALEETRRSRPADHPVIRALRAAVYGHLHRTAEAREEWRLATAEIPQIAEEPRSWVVSRGVSPSLTCEIMAGLDKAGLLLDR